MHALLTKETRAADNVSNAVTRSRNPRATECVFRDNHTGYISWQECAEDRKQLLDNA